MSSVIYNCHNKMSDGRREPHGEEVNARKGEDNYELQYHSGLAHLNAALSTERTNNSNVNNIMQQALQNAVSVANTLATNQATSIHAMNTQANNLVANQTATVHSANSQSNLDAQAQNAMSRHHQNIMADQYTTTSPWEARGEAMAGRSQVAADVNMSHRQVTANELADAMKPILASIPGIVAAAVAETLALSKKE